ncbi:unnamed protein product [Cylicocyclus nassatus]|uniref:Secreted protein n=1 Tax=Cylicocyclus nassatus TaxID=53992 RepID=A0AA36GQW6_CYLNA|nr:unnamed protein product [Cylicocyclus nassatus]
MEVLICATAFICILLVPSEAFAVKKRCFRSNVRKFTIVLYKDDTRKVFQAEAHPALDTKEGFFLLLTIMAMKNDVKSFLFNFKATKSKSEGYVTDLLTPGALNNWLLSCQLVSTADFTHIFGKFPIDPLEVVKF